MITFIITAKNEPHLERTVEDLHANAGLPVQVLAEEDDGRGQRAMIHKLVEQADHDIICKVDAHCSFGPDFAKILLPDMDERTVLAPVVYPLDENWNINHHNPMANFRFDDKLIMHHVPAPPGDLVETMCMQGSFFMCYKSFFYEANLCDPTIGSWGNQAVELGIQTWYTGGRCLISKKTYYGHIFRHSDEEFPYQRSQSEIDETYNRFIKKYEDFDLGWLVNKFQPTYVHNS